MQAATEKNAGSSSPKLNTHFDPAMPKEPIPPLTSNLPFAKRAEFRKYKSKTRVITLCGT